jgi:hypothetical protein
VKAPRKRESAAEVRARRGESAALEALLEDVGLRVIGIGERGRGRRIRVAGGVMYLAVRKARRIRDVATGALIMVPEVRRLVWKGPRLVD